MTNLCEMGIQDSLDYANELFDAIDEFYKTEDDYFAKVDGREQSVVFRIAHILANRLERKYNVYVDCEANRCNGDSKRVPANSFWRELLKAEFITPDLIIHKRNGKSYIAVEFKTSKRDMKHDYEKLAFLTADKGEYLNGSFPTYDLGLSILLGNNKIKEVKCFVNGKEYQFDAQ